MSYVERMTELSAQTAEKDSPDSEDELLEELLDKQIQQYIEMYPDATPDEVKRIRAFLIEPARKQLEYERKITQLEEQQTTDTLVTSVLNHGYFLKVLDREVQETERMPEPSSVLIGLDVDDFKIANEVLGHEGADQLLIALGATLAGAIRPGDSAGRTGGDEFSLLLRRTNTDNATLAAQRIKQKVDETMMQFAKDGFIQTISMGLCLIPKGRTVAEVRNTADAALYTIKNNGKNQIAVGEFNYETGHLETYIVPSPNQATALPIPQHI